VRKDGEVAHTSIFVKCLRHENANVHKRALARLRPDGKKCRLPAAPGDSRSATGGTFITLAIDKTTLEAQIRRDLRSPDVLHSLSQRRWEVLQMVAEGRSTKEIAEGLAYLPQNRGIPQRYRGMESLGLHTIAELVLYAIKHGMVSP